MREPGLHRLVYLRRHDGELCTLCLAGPGDADDLIPVTEADMYQMIDKYLTIIGVLPLRVAELSKEERRAAETGPFVSMEEVIAERMGMSIDEATAWFQRKQVEAAAKWAELERRFRPYRFEDLQYGEDGFTLRLRRPRDQSRIARLTAADMARLADSYLAQRGKWTMVIIARCKQMTLKHTAEWLKQQGADGRAESTALVLEQLRAMAPKDSDQMRR